MKKYRILALIMALFLSVTVVACKNTPQTGSSVSSDSTTVIAGSGTVSSSNVTGETLGEGETSQTANSTGTASNGQQAGTTSGNTNKPDPNKPASNPNKLVLPAYKVTNKTVRMVVGSDFTKTDPNVDSWAKTRALAKKYYDIDLVPIVTPAAQQTSKIVSLIASGSPPDIIEPHKVPTWFPRMCNQGVFASIDSYINFDDMLWKDNAFMMEAYKLDGKHYALVDGGYSPVEIIYSRKLVREFGMTDPMELYKKNQWTWEKFIEYIDEISGDEDGDGKIDVYGTDVWQLAHCYMTSMGAGISVVKNGKINLDPIKGKNYEVYGKFAMDLFKKGSSGYIVPIDNSAGDPQDLLVQDKQLFSFGGRWLILNNPTLTAKKNTGDLGLIPPPRHKSADKYYCWGITSGYAFPAKGNVVGAIATISASRYENFPTANYLKQAKNKFISDKWDADSAHILAYDIGGQAGSYQKLNFISMGVDFLSSTLNSTVNDLLYDPLFKGVSWSSARDQYIGKIQSAADAANKEFK